MKTNKLKFLSIAICCFVVSLSEAQCAQKLEKNDEYRQNHQLGFVPTGGIISFAAEAVPDGWLLCDGQIVSRSEYKNLYDVIGRTYTPTNHNPPIGQSLFCVPDLRGRVIVGVDGATGRVTKNNTLGEGGGEETHTLTLPEIPKHSHEASGLSSDKTYWFGSGQASVFGKNTLSAGEDKPHNNMQPYLVLNYIINTGKMNNKLEFNRQDEKINQLEKKINDLEISKQRYATMFDDLVVQVRQGLNPGCAKAWVVFNGSNPDTLNSYGVSSVTRNDTGIYTINFSKPFNSTNYCSSLSASDELGSGYAILSTPGHGPLPGKQTNNSFVLRTFYILNWQSIDPLRVSACFYGTQ